MVTTAERKPGDDVTKRIAAAAIGLGALVAVPAVSFADGSQGAACVKEFSRQILRADIDMKSRKDVIALLGKPDSVVDLNGGQSYLYYYKGDGRCGVVARDELTSTPATVVDVAFTLYKDVDMAVDVTFR